MKISGIIRSIFIFLLLLGACSLYADNSYAQQAGTSTVTSGANNGTDANSDIKGCGSDTGLFNELLNKGAEIFRGLREIIYVVAGFGILAVAVGGFFGNLNWKWLGAIVIGLMVIASTGEILNMIVGCETYTSQHIADTLK